MIHELLEKRIQPGDTIVDATVGNGFDTAFLAKIVGDKGRVIGFDIQENAIKNTENRLTIEGLLERVRLIQDSHSNIDQYIQDPIHGAVFNLGYLPNGDQKVITRAESTIEALQKTSSLLLPGGFITILSYWGHPGGMKEKEAVESFLKKMDNKKYITGQFCYLNRLGNPPILYMIEKI